MNQIKINVLYSKLTFILRWKSSTKEGDRPQQVDGEGKRFSWFHQMGLQVCSELVHVLFECIALHEQGPMHGVIMLMEVV
jgi:hypothetical protein